jgi:hypothetical protein
MVMALKAAEKLDKPRLDVFLHNCLKTGVFPQLFSPPPPLLTRKA